MIMRRLIGVLVGFGVAVGVLGPSTAELRGVPLRCRVEARHPTVASGVSLPVGARCFT
jgi:hypothetical protein